MTPEEAEEATRLLLAARSDLRAALALAADPEQADEVVGFHAQQAVEKAVKVLLAAAGGEVPYTHDLRFLLDIAVERHVALPSEVAESDWLTPWAVAARYGAAGSSLDRGSALLAARIAVDCASSSLEPPAGDVPR